MFYKLPELHHDYKQWRNWVRTWADAFSRFLGTSIDVNLGSPVIWGDISVLVHVSLSSPSKYILCLFLINLQTLPFKTPLLKYFTMLLFTLFCGCLFKKPRLKDVCLSDI